MAAVLAAAAFLLRASRKFAEEERLPNVDWHGWSDEDTSPFDSAMWN
jgi:hypothetical protein